MRHLIVMLLLATVPPALCAEIYECVEANGNRRFTNITPEAADCKPLNVSPPASGSDAQLRETAAETQALSSGLTTWLSATREDSKARREALEDWPSDRHQDVDVLTYALTDPDEAVRTRAQELLEDVLRR